MSRESTGSRLSLDELKTLITEKWPESFYSGSDWSSLRFTTGAVELDRLFPEGGIPYGQLIELSGDISSGKTSLVFVMLAAITRTGTAAYIDLHGTLFPPAAMTGGVDLERLLVIRPDTLAAGLRATELLFRHRLACCVVIDLVGHRLPLPYTLLHRLRLQTIRAKGMVIFLTENNASLIPASITSLRLEITRRSSRIIAATVTRSRFTLHGGTAEVRLT
ncbi:MAG: hypothetical protein IPH75_04275 [bacterium]|nr:hypothetical protein [bacterium]